MEKQYTEISIHICWKMILKMGTLYSYPWNKHNTTHDFVSKNDIVFLSGVLENDIHHICQEGQ